MNQPIKAYLGQIRQSLATGATTEHTHRPALATLLENIAPDVQAINEPRRIACGAPDLGVLKNRLMVGHVEAKDIGASLDAVERSPQLGRYRQALDNLILRSSTTAVREDPMSPHIRKSTLVDDVAHELRQMILTGEIKPGGFLPTRKELAVQFGVGLSTVHEAIQALTAVGMVKSRPGKGTWVREDVLDTLIHPAAVQTRLGELNARQVYEARFVIEVALTEFAAERVAPEDVERIWNAVKAMEATLADDEAFVEADLEFHLAVARAGHNELLEQFYSVTAILA